MRRPASLALLATSTLLILVPTALPDSLRADQPNPKRNLAVTDPALADPDFAVQGEYLDRVRLPNGETRYMGLQVVSLGSSQFEGVVLQGGLPGAGWDRSHRSSVRGETLEDATTLIGDLYQVVIRDGAAELHDAGGAPLGRLEKIHRISPTQGQAPPAGAIVLFDGSEPEHLSNAKRTDEGLLMTGTTTKMPVRDFRLHIEFRTPYMPYAVGQQRGNSGTYIQRRYEVQILDSFGLEGKANECGGLYRQTPPDVNMCFPPLSWQTYDIDFTAARFDEQGQKRSNARLTLIHNGEPVHQNREITAKTGAGSEEGPNPLPIHFQHHGNPVVFRNMWIVLRDAPVESGGDQVGCESTTEWYAPHCRTRCRLLPSRRWCR